MSLSIIAAVGKNNELGRKNKLLWHFKEDMHFFKDLTTGHPVIMGRRTFESLPDGALPNRRNIVITSRENYYAENAEVVCSVHEALKAVLNDKEAYIIGGAKVYAQLLPQCDNIYLTEIDAEYPTADVFFPDFNKSNYKRKKLGEHTVNGIHFEHIVYSVR